jgi:hypothetical protein
MADQTYDQTGVTAQRRRTRTEIEQLVAEFAGSGLNRTEFCRRQHLTLGTLNRYLQHEATSQDGSARRRLVAVELAGAKTIMGNHSGSGLAVVLREGRTIEVEAGFDAATLERLLRLLENL